MICFHESTVFTLFQHTASRTGEFAYYCIELFENRFL